MKESRNTCYMAQTTDVFFSQDTFLGMVGGWGVTDVLHGICSNESEAHFILQTSAQHWSLGRNYSYFLQLGGSVCDRSTD